MPDKKIIIIGSGKLALDIAVYLRERGNEAIIYEKRISGSRFVEKLCKSRNIEYRCFDTEEMTEALKEDLRNYRLKVISAVNTYIFPKDIVEHRNFDGINYHNALLPYHRGMNAEAWAIYEMDSYTGITWHRISTAVDCGEIIVQRKIALDSSITSLKLLKKQTDIAFEAFKEFADKFIADERLECVTQINKKCGFHKIKDIPNDGYINEKWDMSQIGAFLRAMDYGKLETLSEPRLKIGSATFIWDRYKFVENQREEKDMVRIEDNNIIITKNNCGRHIVLTNIKVLEDVG